jgi:hypothetical protein
MALKLSQDSEQNNKVNDGSKNVNKKYMLSGDKEGSSDDTNVQMHNTIHNKFIKYVKKKKTMTDAYFKSTLTCVYDDVYKKHLVFKNIPDDPDIQNNIKSILQDVSYSKCYSILNYYAKEGGKDIIGAKDIIDVTAMFYSTLHHFIKREFADK